MPVFDPDAEAQLDAQLAGKAAPSTPIPSGPFDADSEAQLDKALAAQPPEAQEAGLANAANPAKDIAKSIGTGLVRGAEATFGMPGTLSQGLDSWTSYGALKAAELASPYLPNNMKLPGTAEDAARASYKLEKGGVPTGITHGDLSMPTAPQMQAVGSAITGPLHQPETPYGEVAGNVASFVPGALAAPGNSIAQAARNAIAYGVVPGVTSEGAGRLAKTFLGDWAEPYARGLGAIGGAVVGHGTAAPLPSDTVLANATRGMTDADIASAQAIQQRAKGQGIDITGAEALGQATQGAGNLSRVQRVLEGADRSAPIMQNYFANRPSQITGAANNAFDTIAPPTQQPSAVGAQAQGAAQANLKAIQDHINTVTDPYYRAADNHLIPSQYFDPIANDPAFQNSLAKLRNDDVLGPKYAAFPDNSIKVINAVTKDMGAQGTTLGNATVKGYQPEKSADFYSGAGNARDIARNPATGGSPEYDAALLMQADARRRLLEPQQAGPVGQIAGTGDVRAQGNILYPSNPQEGSQYETGNAVRALENMQPGLPAQLTRQHLANQFNEAMQQNIPGANQWGGAKFAAQVFGNPQQEANIQAGLGALPNSPNLNPLVEALRATGQREAKGSQTAFNTGTMQGDLSRGSPFGSLGSLVLSPEKALGAARDTYLKYRLGANTEDLAKALTGPDFFDRLQKARGGAPQGQSALLQALMARGAITPPVLPMIAQSARPVENPNQ